MKRGVVIIALLLVAVFLSVISYVSGGTSPKTENVLTPTPTTPPKAQTEESSLFVPYWSLNTSLPTEYDRLIYFGVTPTLDGINTDEAGYQGVRTFISDSPTIKHHSLTLRMLDNSQNFTILKDTDTQQKIISGTINLAKESGYDGIVLDLELKALPFDSLMKQINTFTGNFYHQAKEKNLHFAITQYGDTFYRVRPFDVETLAKNADEVMIMAYDFHKAGGDPGPSFPLHGKETYGYDLTEMADGFLKVVPPDKLTVIFGYFGYDWPTDDKEKAINQAASFSLVDIKKQYLTNCASCTITRDPLSDETHITYLSADNVHHTVWFDDEVSISAKKDYLKSRGISSFSYWAYSYF